MYVTTVLILYCRYFVNAGYCRGLTLNSWSSGTLEIIVTAVCTKCYCTWCNSTWCYCTKCKCYCTNRSSTVQQFQSSYCDPRPHSSSHTKCQLRQSDTRLLRYSGFFLSLASCQLELINPLQYQLTADYRLVTRYVDSAAKTYFREMAVSLMDLDHGCSPVLLHSNVEFL